MTTNGTAASGTGANVMIAKTVLIIEDDFIIALDYKWRLEKAGWKVVGPAATVQA